MIIWLVVLIGVEATTELIVASKIFFSLRTFISKRSKFIGELFSCGYCLSVWVAFAGAFFVPGQWTNPYVDHFLKLLVLHRASNILHSIISRVLKRLPFEFVFNLVHLQSQPPVENPVVEVPDEPPPH